MEAEAIQKRVLDAVTDRPLGPEDLARRLGIEPEMLKRALWNLLEAGLLVLTVDWKVKKPSGAETRAPK
jgi:DNA-binding HxlR family transcriptional regulator